MTTKSFIGLSINEINENQKNFNSIGKFDYSPQFMLIQSSSQELTNFKAFFHRVELEFVGTLDLIIF